jgi:hypothetical protein
METLFIIIIIAQQRSGDFPGTDQPGRCSRFFARKCTTAWAFSPILTERTVLAHGVTAEGVSGKSLLR